ncbi:hypothetical protein QRD89_15500 [Halobacillus sp. ACCC02827]|uniref:hypothetical protein n=1 Tax=Halobacillus sp. ACCC02827 TaxID=3052090 RepID=UPI0009EE44E1|nr:hypothetical protein [Halobacillus sp. ACCC02827]WJE15111.1 hypothetical protein QRD89_15500 [Halobacillus sp. ACCC02827]
MPERNGALFFNGKRVGKTVKYFFDFTLAIALTGCSYYIAGFLLSHGLPFWQALIIGFSVVTLGALTEAVGSPMWLIVLVPFPAGMLLLYVFLGAAVPQWLLAYGLTLAVYTAIHIPMSYFFRFHSLIPAWKLS